METRPFDTGVEARLRLLAGSSVVGGDIASVLAALEAEKKAHADTARLAEQRLAERNSVQGEFDEALAAKKLTELERDTALGQVGYLDGLIEKAYDAFRASEHNREFVGSIAEAVTWLAKERDTCAEQLAGALALLGIHREALKTLKARLPLDGSKRNAELLEMVYASLALTAPDALRQQQEREAEKDALIERLRAAARHDDDCFIDGDFRNGERIPGRCTCWLAALDSTKGGQ